MTVAVLLALLGLSVAWQLVQAPITPVAALEGVIAVALGLALVAHHQVTVDVANRRMNRDASVTRILQGLSRSVSPESVVDAIVQELRVTAGADHVSSRGSGIPIRSSR